MAKRKLKRQLNLMQVIMLGTAGTIAAEIFVLTGHVAKIAGPESVLALALGGLLLVRYAIENDLIGPGLRITFGALLAGALAVAGEHMPAARVEVIQLQRDRHALFLHEHALAHRAQLVERIRVVRDDDLERAGDSAHAPSPVASA